jgi:hypothetical protein
VNTPLPGLAHPAHGATDPTDVPTDEDSAEQVVAAFGFVDVDLHRDSLDCRDRFAMERPERVRGMVGRR